MYLLLFIIDNEILIVIKVSIAMILIVCNICIYYLFPLIILISITNSSTIIISTSILFCYYKCIATSYIITVNCNYPSPLSASSFTIYINSCLLPL